MLLTSLDRSNVVCRGQPHPCLIPGQAGGVQYLVIPLIKRPTETCTQKSELVEEAFNKAVFPAY